MNRKTFGEQVNDNIINKSNYHALTLEEIQYHFREDYFRNLMIAKDDGKKIWPQRNFYILALTRIIKLAKDMPRIQWYKTQDCPHPSFSQTVFKYNYLDDSVDELWTLPSEEMANTMRYQVLDINPLERERYQDVRDYFDGTLLKLCKNLNGEQRDTNLLEGRSPISEKNAKIVSELIEQRQEIYDRQKA